MMIRKDFLVAVSVLILMASPLLSLLPVSGNVAVQEPEVSAPVLVTSDYTVNSGDIDELNNVDYDMTGNIMVNSGGILYINNSYIQFNCSDHGEYGIYVENGGELYINDSNITAVNTTAKLEPLNPNSMWDLFYGLGWVFEINGLTNITDSTLSYMWGDQGNTQYDIAGGVQIYSDDVHIKDTLIYNSCNMGISIMDSGFNYNYGASPMLDGVVVHNTSGIGIMVMGDQSAPTIHNSRISGSSNQGAYFFIGVDAMVNYTVFRHNELEGVVLHDSGASGYTSENEFHNCTFRHNAHGVGFGEGGAAMFYDSDIRHNMYSGIIDADYETSSSMGKFHSCNIHSNGESGVNITAGSSSMTFTDCSINENGMHGADVDNAMGVYIIDSTLNSNNGFGLWTNGTADTKLQGCQLTTNMNGGVRATNGSAPHMVGNTISESMYGVLALDSDPAFSGNMITGNDVGVRVMGDCDPSFMSGELDNNNIGIHAAANGVNIEGQNVSGSSDAGIVVGNADPATIQFCDLANNEVGIRVFGGDHTRIRNTTVGGSNHGIELDNGANITVRGSDMSSNSVDFHLDGSSIARAYSMGTDTDDVIVADADSEFWHYWSLELEVYDNVTLEPITQADMMIYSKEGELLASEQTFFDGKVKGDAAEYNIIGSNTTDMTPVNLTVSKDGYVPFIDQDHPHNGDHYQVIYMAENIAPELPFPPNNAPTITHQNRPVITWDPPYDWNDDDIDYRVTVWQDEMRTGQVIVDREIVKEPRYNFTKNLRYNHEFWVEVFAFDPWGEPFGLNDTTTFSFRTINTPPTVPVIGFSESPIPSLEDIEIMILNASTDEDTNPADMISYLVQWEAYREETWVLLNSGSNAFVLDSNLTREGDRVRVSVKPFDGIQYGEEVTMEIDVVNFVPHTLIPYADITIDEDTPTSGLVDLESMFMDRDGDSLSFNIKVARHVGASIDKATNEITFIPDPDYQGSDYLIVEAMDSKPHTEDNPTVRINVTVNGMNDAPFISEVDGKIVEKGSPSLVQNTQGTNLTITVTGEDPDGPYGDEVEYSTDFLDVIGMEPDWYSFERTTGRMVVYLSNSLVGEHDFNITIIDSNDESTSTPVRLIVENRNDAPTPPMFSSHQDGDVIRIEEGDEKVVLFTAEPSDDPDLHIPGSEEYLEYDWNFGDGWLENRGLEVENEFIVSGEYEVRLRVRDSLGLYEESSIMVNVNVTEDEFQGYVEPEEDSFMEQYGLLTILIVVAAIVLIVIVLVIIRKDDLSDTAGSVEEEHEALVAKQQEDALVAQERLQSLMQGTPYPETSGPALPSGQQQEGPGYDALPSASPEGQEQYPPQEGYPEQPQTGYQEPMPAPGQEQPMQAPPEQAPPQEPAPQEAQQPMQAPPEQTGYQEPQQPAPQEAQQPMQAPPEQQPQQAAPPQEPAPQQPEQQPGATPPDQQQGENKPSYLPPEDQQ